MNQTFGASLLTILLLIFIKPANGQEKFNFSSGFGITELLHAGVRYQTGQSEIGLSVGSIPAGSGEQIITLSGDFYYHFSGASKFSERKPLYIKIGLNSIRDETDYVLDKYTNLNTRFGRDFNISRKFGAWIELGAFWIIENKNIHKKNPGWPSFSFNEIVIPAFGAGVFYRLRK
jgi:hypothetical protein